ncbi:MAG: alpha/beta hydrolase [Clostridium sp.]|uniref:alpha/beta hydrolase n=1 Tax=Clostridium sp. TaxID=1506 RepID=UPI003D6D4400
MWNYLIKWQYNLMNFIGEKFIFNQHAPDISNLLKNIQYGKETHKERLLDIAIPYGKGSFPILIYIHGGGWISGSKDGYSRICKSFAHEGYLTFNINYRLTPKYSYPIQIQDISDAIDWICNNAEKYGGDINKIFLAGDSSGAHLVSHYVTIVNNDELKKYCKIKNLISLDYVRGILLFYGVYNIKKLDAINSFIVRIQNQSFLGKNTNQYQERCEYVSPIFYINKQFPPTFLCAGEVDLMHSQSIEFMKKLKKNNVPYDMISLGKEEYPEARHAFLNFYNRKCSKAAMNEALKFMNSHSEVKKR